METRRKTGSGLDCETLEHMAAFYKDVWSKQVEEVLEAAILFHADPSYKTFLTLYNKLTYCRENMIRQEVFVTHNR